MNHNLEVVARPAGVYLCRSDKGLVWRTCLERQTRILAPCQGLANPIGPEADGNPLPALTTTRKDRAMASRFIAPIDYPRKTYVKTQCGEIIAGRQVAPREAPNPVVYFVQAENGLIKIGSTKRIGMRLSALFAGSPIGLVLLATTKGNRATEYEFHRLFVEHRLHGEWFHPHPDIMAEIKRINAHNPIAGAGA